MEYKKLWTMGMKDMKQVKKDFAQKNSFFDINKLPNNEGIIVFGISMSRIANAQSPKKCLEYVEYFRSKIQYTEGIALEFCYGDYLYFHSDVPAHVLRDRYLTQMISHKNAFLRLLRKDRKWTNKAFSFKTLGQVFLDNAKIYSAAFQKIREFYNTDSVFQMYIKQDCINVHHGLSEKEADFILEEITLFYLLQKGLLRLNGRFVTDEERKWVLLAYPGKPLKSEAYLFQSNPLKLSDSGNLYEQCYYNIEEKVLYDYTRLDIETFDFSS